MVVRELQLNPALGIRAIGFVDDDPRKRGMGLLGLRVLGTTDQIAELLEKHNPDEVVIAIPSGITAVEKRAVLDSAERAEVPAQNGAGQDVGNPGGEQLGRHRAAPAAQVPRAGHGRSPVAMGRSGSVIQ